MPSKLTDTFIKKFCNKFSLKRKKKTFNREQVVKKKINKIAIKNYYENSVQHFKLSEVGYS